MLVQFRVLGHLESNVYVMDRAFAWIGFMALALDKGHSFIGRAF